VLHVGRVDLVAGDHVAVGEEHRVEGEALEAATVHRRDRGPVARDADEAHEALIARFHGGPQRALVTQGELPLVGMHEAVQLDQIDLINAHTLERAPDLLARRRIGALAGLGGEEEVATVLAQPRRQA